MDRTCDQIRELIADQIAGSLPESERKQVELHLQTCDGCRLYRDQLHKQDRDISDWASALEPQLRSGLDQTLTAVRMEAGGRAVAFSHRRTGFPFWRAIAAGLLLAIGFFAGIFSNSWRSGGNLPSPVGALSPEARAELIGEILVDVRNEIEQQSNLTKQQLGKEFSQKLQETADSFSQTLNRDREWMSTALAAWEGKRSEERALLYRDIAKLAKITENEFIRTRRYMDQSRIPIENYRPSDRTSEEPIQGRPL